MKITRLPVDPGPAGWNALLPEAAAPVPLESAVTADWLVIGAGIAGLAAARRLAQLHPGDRIVVLEARRVAEGPAGRNSGFMIDLPHDLTSEDYGGAIERDRFQIRANRHAIAFAHGAVEEYGLTQEAFDPCGKINAAATEKGHRHNLDFARHLKALGEPCEMLDAGQMQELCGTGYYHSGLFTPGAVMVQPAMYVRGVAQGLASNRVQIHEGSPVVALDRSGDWVAKTPKGQVVAPRVILAVNGHAEAFGQFTGRLMHVFTYASMTRALTKGEVARLGGQARWGVTPSDPLGTTVRRISGTGGDRIVVRNRFTFNPTLESSDAQLARVVRDHDRAFAARFPMLAGVDMEYRWGGRLCLSRNGVAAFGQSDEGLFSACCQNGLGLAKGTLGGVLAAEQASGVGSDLLDGMLAEAEPQRLPWGPVARIGATAVLRWGEKRAGREL
ncbi:FAD-binding oxidoreductase [Mameliella alba]|nr:FAD-binding oxidoreductase [Mameliella alba]MBY6167744.1 FAD-binding oxidoreductase [Mameliella alba]MBY6172765.1 FAD-binding oxidoreductase [Mameliella alba]